MYLSTSLLSVLWVGWSSPLFWIGCKPILGISFQRKPTPPGELPLTPTVAKGCSPIYVKTWTFSVFSPLRSVELRGGGPDHRHAPARSTYGLKSHTWSNRNESHIFRSRPIRLQRNKKWSVLIGRERGWTGTSVVISNWSDSSRNLIRRLSELSRD